MKRNTQNESERKKKKKIDRETTKGYRKENQTNKQTNKQTVVLKKKSTVSTYEIKVRNKQQGTCMSPTTMFVNEMKEKNPKATNR
jgi:hypothetical protein